MQLHRHTQAHTYLAVCWLQCPFNASGLLLGLLCRFTGTLQDMTLLPSLDWLDLSDNSLGGPMPPLPPSVRWVDLSNNQLSGAVKLPVAPRHADESVALVLLNVANNKLSGESASLRTCSRCVMPRLGRGCVDVCVCCHPHALTEECVPVCLGVLVCL